MLTLINIKMTLINIKTMVINVKNNLKYLPIRVQDSSFGSESFTTSA